ncbi:MAG: uroporphyrinogen-III C-methyltransferase [Pseudomonadota bacterium]
MTQEIKIYPVSIVGAGPGDPELLTLKAKRLLGDAQVVIYDRLISPQIIAMINPGAETVFAGKSCKHHIMTQDQINLSLVEFAKLGKKVVRLKGGDPFIFGRGGEEIEFLLEHNIPFETVPGISSASGCSTAFNIPLTHRDLSNNVRYVTGHAKANKLDLDWEKIVNPAGTLVIYMGLANVNLICENLIKHGLPENFPIAVIENGTLDNQRIVVGELLDIADKVKIADLQSPSLIIVGKVVSLYYKFKP